MDCPITPFTPSFLGMEKSPGPPPGVARTRCSPTARRCCYRSTSTWRCGGGFAQNSPGIFGATSMPMCLSVFLSNTLKKTQI